MTGKKLPAIAALGIAFVTGFTSRGLTAERHPELRRALQALSNAERFLTQADRDFSGHRTKAVELIHGAQRELNEALASDKQ
ncbi:MAG: hypothetical protein M3Z85_01415 [Acidobacteriota bacterium]|nr:hypothetical protein [Acidobacteriota bacterium]